MLNSKLDISERVDKAKPVNYIVNMGSQSLDYEQKLMQLKERIEVFNEKMDSKEYHVINNEILLFLDSVEKRKKGNPESATELISMITQAAALGEKLDGKAAIKELHGHMTNYKSYELKL